jgi:hypothetical protein
MKHLALVLAIGLATAAPARAEGLARDAAGLSASVQAARQPQDACGGRGALDTIIPDGVFLDACKGHDACYRSNALDQTRCDADFLTEMRRACRSHFPLATAQLKHVGCQAAAFTYFRAVNSRFGAHEYGAGTTGGAFLSQIQNRIAEADGSDELRVCTHVLNPANRKLHYSVFLENAAGQRLDMAPNWGTLALQAGATGEACVDTNHLPLISAATAGARYSLVLEVDDPDRLALNDQTIVDRLVCSAATGDCVHAAP